MARKRPPADAANGSADGSDRNGFAVAVAAENLRYVDLSTETRRRYLNYALSVITSRALPDVRDGLKPVQRRILYVMFEELRATATAKFVKCARIVGDTIGKYHPHGDGAAYDALVRLAQDFTLRDPLVDGQGNFGSVLGLPPAAQRYTEARLTAIAGQLMDELRFDTVAVRPNYDSTRTEPIVLPARFPNLLVNGASGIAVGMATNIPPHNLDEIIRACGQLIDNPDASTPQLLRSVKGPDFPLGGRIVTDRETIKQIYEEGRGSIRVRGEWRFDTEPDKRGGERTVKNRLVIHSVPFGVSTSPLVAELGAIAEGRKIPQLVEVNDETDKRSGLRITLVIKSPDDADAVMAYLYKHTALEQNFAVNLTALVPSEQGALVPARMGLAEMLRHFLTFRLATVRRRFQFQLRQLERRIHILEGFAILFHGIDRAIAIIRASDGKEDACEALIGAFPLDREQTMAVLELMLYRISRLEIDTILAELEEKQAAATEIRAILDREDRLWGVVRSELDEVAKQFGTKRRTAIGNEEEITEFDPTAYIVRENTHVVVTRDGWVKRVGTLRSIETTRVRDGDAVLAVCPASTLENIIFFASDGTAYTLPVQELPVSTGYGEPLGKFVKLGDGVRVVAAITTDPRFTPPDAPADGETPPTPHLFVTTRGGMVTRLGLTSFRPAGTKSGRRFMRLSDGDAVIHAELCGDAISVFLASKQARLIHFALDEVPVLSGAGKGVKGISLDASDALLGAMLLSRPGDTLHAVNENGNALAFGQMKYGVTGRGGKGIKTSQRTGLVELARPEISIRDWAQISG